MKKGHAGLGATTALAIAAVMAPAPALADATLQAQIVGVSCTVTSPAGTTTVPCSASSWNVLLQPGWSAQMVATVDYAYRDDGWVLAPRGGNAFQMDSGGFTMRFVDHEAGALYAMTSHCVHRYCVHPPGQVTFGESGFPPVFLSDNDVPDSLQGRLTIATGAALNAEVPFTWTANVYIGLRTQTISGVEPVAAIPEPATWASMLVSLAALATVMQRRRSRGALSR